MATSIDIPEFNGGGFTRTKLRDDDSFDPVHERELADCAQSALSSLTSTGLRTPISLYQPDLSGNERKYLLECIDSSWISSQGAFVGQFEKQFAETVGASHAIAVSNGTVALHLALHALDIGPGDEVVVPSFTYVASVNVIAQTGAIPVFVDSRPDDWLLDPDDVARKVGPRTKAIMPVHLYGAVCDMAAIGKIAEKHGLAIVEDAAEGIGCRLNGQHAGTFGVLGAFSFYANKTITTGEGGMVVTNDSCVADRVTLLRNQGQSPTRRYWHVVAGFNYRMTNMSAAIGVAQLERLASIVERKQEIASQYRNLLADDPVTFQSRHPDVESAEWLVSVLLPSDIDRDRVIDLMAADGVETRPTFYCAHQMPMYAATLELPVAVQIARRGISLPSYPQMSEDDVACVVTALRNAIDKASAVEMNGIRRPWTAGLS